MVKILIADDHDLVRDTIAAFLEASEGYTVLKAANLGAALELFDTHSDIDLLILDYNMPGMNGLNGFELAKSRLGDIPIAILSGVANRVVAETAMERGACGFIPKSLTAVSMVNAIKFVLSGERYIPYEIGDGLEIPKDLGVFSELSNREMQTLEQLCGGLSNKEIARNLGIAEATVKLHVKNILAKLDVTNRTQAALLAKAKHLF